MKARWSRWWRRWWRQRAMWGAHGHMSRQKRWGVNFETLTYIGSLIEPHLENVTGRKLKAVHGQLHTRTIDELTTDLTIVQRSLERRDYVDERLIYIHMQPTTLYRYLALSTGRALNPVEAWKVFHSTALSVTHEIDTMLMDSADEADRGYYLRRYGTVFAETYRVYQLFAALTDLSIPDLPVV